MSEEAEQKKTEQVANPSPEAEAGPKASTSADEKKPENASKEGETGSQEQPAKPSEGADASPSSESETEVKPEAATEGSDVPSGAAKPAPASPPAPGRGGRRPDRRSRSLEDKGVEKYWVPRTKLGNLVRDGTITTMDQVLNSGFILREPEIVDILLGELEDEVIDVNMVQRMTDSGRRVRFAVTVAVGNGNGFLGLGRAHGREVGPTIRKAIDNAKINIISLKRGCGSWECSCGAPHSIPYKTEGKSGSVLVTFRPAPRGVGLAAGDVAKKILKLGGVKDLWATTKGQTQTTINYASAVYYALTNLSAMRINDRQTEKFQIISGGIEK